MAVGVYGVKHVAHVPIRPHHHRHAGDSFVFSAVKLLLTPHPIRYADVARVADERKREAFFGAELLVGLHGVPTDPEDNCILGGELVVERSKLLRFDGSTGSRVFRVKVKNYRLSTQGGQRDLTAVGCGGKVGGGFTNGESGHDVDVTFPLGALTLPDAASKTGRCEKRLGDSMLVPVGVPTGRGRARDLASARLRRFRWSILSK